MKKFFVKLVLVFLSLTMVICFAACEDKNNASVSNQPPADSSSQSDTSENSFSTIDPPYTTEQIAVQDYTEQQIKANVANSYLNNLNGSPTKTLSEAEVVQAKEDGLLSEIEIDPSQINKGKKVVYKKRSAQYGIEDISYYGVNNNITYPGSLLKIKNIGTELSPIIGLKRKPLKMSLGIEGATGIDYKSATVSEITKSSVGQGINEMVKGATKPGAQLPFIIAVQLTEIKAKEELNAALGLSFNVGSFFDLSSKFNFKTKNENTYAVLTLKQIYYTVDVDYNSTYGVFSLLDDSVSLEQIKRACPSNYSPVYVSSVSYGRIAAITIKTSDSFSELSAKLNLGGGFWKLDADFSANFDKSTQINNLEYNWFIYGGSIAGNQEVLNGKNINDMINSLNQPYDSSKIVGVPISYQLSHIADNSSAKIGYVGDYYYSELVDCDVQLGTGMTDRIDVDFYKEFLVKDGYGNYDAYGAGYVANNNCLKIDISKLDLDYIKSLGHNIEITIELSIKEEDDGYQEIYLYNAGVNSKDVQKGKAPMIASITMEHDAGKCNKNYQRYVLKGVISPDSITKKELWIAFDAYGRNDDNWKAKDINISLRKTNEKTYTLYSSKK